MNSKYNIEATDHVTAADHESEEELGNTPSQGAPNPSGWHHLPTGSAYSLRSREATKNSLEFPDGAVVRVLDSPTDPAHAPLLMEFVLSPGAMPTAAHIHPHQEETYAVQEGSLEVLIGREWSTLEAGQSATVPAGTPHAFRNRSGSTVRFLNEHCPALRFEDYFRAVHRFSEAGKIKGGFDIRGVLYACVLMEEYGDTMRAARAAQGALVRVLATVGRLLGIDAQEDPVESR